MNRIAKINFWGISLTAATLVTSSALIGACGPAPMAVKPAFPTNVASTNAVNPVNPALLPKSVQALSDVGSFSAAQQAQINSLMGSYTGTYYGDDADGSPTQAEYNLVISKGTSPSAPGKTFVQVSFTAGNVAFTSLMLTTYLAPGMGNPGPTYTFASTLQSVGSIDATGPFYLILQLSLNASNQFDPALSANNNGSLGPIRLVDSVSLNSVVDFYDDFQRH